MARTNGLLLIALSASLFHCLRDTVSVHIDSSGRPGSDSSDSSGNKRDQSSADSSHRFSSASWGSDSSEDSSQASDSSEDIGSSGAYGYSRSLSSGICHRCKDGGIGPWYLQKRLWYQIVWHGDKICFRGCYKHEDAREGKTRCTSTNGAVTGGCAKRNIKGCKKWSGCHDIPYDFFTPSCETCKYLGMRRSTIARSLVLPVQGTCESKIVSWNRTCCSAGSTLDKNGNCCASGHVDACGKCDGNAKEVDILGQCCDGDIAADGICCQGHIDECGICGGTGTTCRLQAEYLLRGNSTAQLLDLAYRLVPAALSGLAPEQIAPADIEIKMEDYIVSENATNLTAIGLFSLPPFFGFDDADDFEDQQIDLLVEQELLGIDYIGTCGNGICEVGEQTRPSRGEGTCEADCTFPVMLDCQCFGRGMCIPSTGVCSCFLGYEGDWCQYCSQNYTELGEHCVPVTIDATESQYPLMTFSDVDSILDESLLTHSPSTRQSVAWTTNFLIVCVVLARGLGGLIACYLFLVRKKVAEAPAWSHYPNNY